MESSSLTRDGTQAVCMGAWSPNHWTTREVTINGFYIVRIPGLVFFCCFTVAVSVGFYHLTLRAVSLDK